MNTFLGLIWLAASALAIIFLLIAFSYVGQSGFRIERSGDEKDIREFNFVMFGLFFVFAYVLVTGWLFSNVLWPSH